MALTYFLPTSKNEEALNSTVVFLSNNYSVNRPTDQGITVNRTQLTQWSQLSAAMRIGSKEQCFHIVTDEGISIS